MRVWRRRMPNGNLSPCFSVEYRHLGRHVIRSTGCATRREAMAFAKTLIEPLRQETSARGLVETHRELLAGAAPIPLGDAWERFKAKPGRRDAGPQQTAASVSRWSDFIAYMSAMHPGATHLGMVTTAHVEGYLTIVKAAGRFAPTAEYRRGRRTVKANVTPRPLAAPSFNVARGVLYAVFHALRHDSGLAVNPVDPVPRAKVDRVTREAFSVTELRELVNGADAFLQPLVIAGASTGLRKGDLCRLRWSEVDLKAGMIVCKTGKTGALARVPLLPGFRDYLQARRPADAKPDAYIFPEQAAMYAANPTGLSWRFKALVAKCGLEGCATVATRPRAVSCRDWHSLRHTYLTLAAAANVPAHLLQQLAGHASPSMTSRYVAHQDDALLQAKLAPAVPGLDLAALLLPAPATPSANDVPPSPAALLAAVKARLATEKRQTALRRDLEAILTGGRP